MLRSHPRRRALAGRTTQTRGFRDVAAALRRGEIVYDRVFDDVFPFAIRRASSVHWTPVEVGMRVAQLLTHGVTSPVLLDVGAGVGKFCTVAAATVKATVHGVEHREHFVEIARQAADKLGVDVEFTHGTIALHEQSEVTGVYLFNPFAENLASRTDHLDESVELSEDAYWRDVIAVERFLDRARVGTRVATYCGWGGAMPASYELVLRERRAGTIELWKKTEPSGELLQCRPPRPNVVGSVGGRGPAGAK